MPSVATRRNESRCRLNEEVIVDVCRCYKVMRKNKTVKARFIQDSQGQIRMQDSQGQTHITQSRPDSHARQSRPDTYKTVKARFWRWVDSKLGLGCNGSRWRMNEEIVDVCRVHKVMKNQASERERGRESFFLRFDRESFRCRANVEYVRQSRPDSGSE